MTKIHRFEIDRARWGGVYCPPLDLNFPALYRVVQNVSRQQLDEAGLTDEEPVESYVHYTIDEHQQFLDSIERSVARGITDAGRRLLSYAGTPIRKSGLAISTHCLTSAILTIGRRAMP